MDIFNFLALIGGLALFLYGMKTMSGGLFKLSGGKLARILERLTTNKFLALFLGLAVTATIQSSSATTVMVVGFVNSGIMKLQQAVGVIMGANIGTSVTAWILSLAGLEGDAVWIRLLKPSSFSPVFAAIGMVLIMLGDKNGVKTRRTNMGIILVGFAILMMGMDSMSKSVSGLADNPKFTGMLVAFSNPILGMLVGVGLSVIIQSSSASIGILQALSTTGVVPYGAAIPIILGDNIGTCITALLASIGGNRNARRASLIHLFFNVIGTCLFMVTFYSINVFVHFEFLHNPASLTGIAVFHSSFNIVCSAILLPFADQLVKLAILAVPERVGEVKPKFVAPPELAALDVRFLNQPNYALGLCLEATQKMAKYTEEAFQLAEDNFLEYSPIKAKRIVDLEETTDLFEDVLGTYLTKLTGRAFSRSDRRLQSIMLHAIGDLERIADHAAKMVELSQKMIDNRLAFSPAAQQELIAFGKALHDIIGQTVAVLTAESLLSDKNLELAKKIEPLEDVVDDLYREMKNRHIERLVSGTCSKEAGLILIDLIRNYERISDHCAKIAICLIESADDAYEVHKYREVATMDDPKFRAEYRRLSGIYKLPPVSEANA